MSDLGQDKKSFKQRREEQKKTSEASGDTRAWNSFLIRPDTGKKECFASCLFICYDLIRSDVALELSWTNNIFGFTFPYILHFIREYTSKVGELLKYKLEAMSEVKSKEQEEKDMVAQQNMYAQLLPLALPAPPMPGMGGGMGGPFSAPPVPPPMGMGGMGMPPMPPFGMPDMPLMGTY